MKHAMMPENLEEVNCVFCWLNGIKEIIQKWFDLKQGEGDEEDQEVTRELYERLNKAIEDQLSKPG